MIISRYYSLINRRKQNRNWITTEKLRYKTRSPRNKALARRRKLCTSTVSTLCKQIKKAVRGPSEVPSDMFGGVAARLTRIPISLRNLVLESINKSLQMKQCQSFLRMYSLLTNKSTDSNQWDFSIFFFCIFD